MARTLGKRKRVSSGGAKSSGRKRVRTTTIKTSVVPGFTRASGYYGRYGGADGEVKFLDTSVNQNCTNAMISAPTADGTIAVIPQGDGQSSRDGRKCRITSIQFDGEVKSTPGAVGDGAALIYMTWVLDTQCNGVAATAADVWSSTLARTQQINLANEGRFKILSRQCYELNATAGVAAAFGATTKRISWRKKVSIPMEYDNTTFTTGVVSTIKRNNVLLFIGDDTSSTATNVVIGTIRTRFVG